MSLEVLRLSLKGQAGALETILEDPGVPGTSYAVICHPHPLFGGTMENKVVTTVARALRETGIPTLRFNFRGAGASDGAFDQGVGETADADAVASWGAEHWPGRTLVAAGFSFGGLVGLRLALLRGCQHGELRFLTTIAPAVQRFDGNSPHAVDAHGWSCREMRMMSWIPPQSSIGSMAWSQSRSFSSCPGGDTSSTGVCRSCATRSWQQFEADEP